MDDEALIERVRQLKPKAADAISAMPSEVLTISDPVIIEAAWGPCRVSSKTRGMVLNAYPASLTAHKKMWERWIAEDRPYVSIVIAKKKAQARIDAALGHVQGGPEAFDAEPSVTITQEEIEDMMAERADLRAARKFAEADKIRDYLFRHGVAVKDRRIDQCAA